MLHTSNTTNATCDSGCAFGGRLSAQGPDASLPVSASSHSSSSSSSAPAASAVVAGAPDGAVGTSSPPPPSAAASSSAVTESCGVATSLDGSRDGGLSDESPAPQMGVRLIMCVLDKAKRSPTTLDSVTAKRHSSVHAVGSRRALTGSAELAER